jgi:TolA-binding protein
MSTLNITKEIEAVINQLIDEGKEPTTALIKARLATPVPIPAIIAALKSWKSTKRVPKVEIAQQPSASAEQRIEALEKQVSELLSRVTHLESLIEKQN